MRLFFVFRYYCNGDVFIMRVLATEDSASGHCFYDLIFAEPSNSIRLGPDGSAREQKQHRQQQQQHRQASTTTEVDAAAALQLQPTSPVVAASNNNAAAAQDAADTQEIVMPM